MIRDFNRIIKVTGSTHLCNALIITVECVALIDGIIAATHYGFSNLEIEGDSKVIIDCYDTKRSYLVELFN